MSHLFPSPPGRHSFRRVHTALSSHSSQASLSFPGHSAASIDIIINTSNRSGSTAKPPRRVSPVPPRKVILQPALPRNEGRGENLRLWSSVPPRKAILSVRVPHPKFDRNDSWKKLHYNFCGLPGCRRSPHPLIYTQTVHSLPSPQSLVSKEAYKVEGQGVMH